VVGEDCAFAAGTFVAGSVTFGNRVTLAGHVIVNGHIRVADDVRVGGNSGIRRDIDKPGDYMGYPLQEKVAHGRHLRALRDLAAMQEELAALKKRLDGEAPAT
jgi:UDP-3-O-[3-hydroxymyristoyl] glucosamine N-acyltransferase